MTDDGPLPETAPGAEPAPRLPKKSPQAFRTISEVARELDLPQHVLRFWETRFAVIKPLKRGGGRRYYRPEDVALLRRIRDLLYTDGYTIKGVQKLLAAGDAAPAQPDAGGDARAEILRRELAAALEELKDLSTHLRRAAVPEGAGDGAGSAPEPGSDSSVASP